MQDVPNSSIEKIPVDNDSSSPEEIVFESRRGSNCNNSRPCGRRIINDDIESGLPGGGIEELCSSLGRRRENNERGLERRRMVDIPRENENEELQGNTNDSRGEESVATFPDNGNMAGGSVGIHGLRHGGNNLQDPTDEGGNQTGCNAESLGFIGAQATNETKRSRDWVFTWNNYSEEAYTSLSTVSTGGEVTYFVIGRETAPDTGTRHLQGYVYFRTLKSFRQVLSWLTGLPGASSSSHPYIAAAIRDSETNRKYCIKGGDYVTGGNIPGQGKRTDLAAVHHAIKEGKDLIDIIDSHPDEMIKYAKNIMLINNILNYQKHRTTKPTVLWFYGPTGSGKSRSALELAQQLGSFYYKNPTNKWWDGYVQQRVVVIDDYRRDFCTFTDLLRILDYYPYYVEIKGGTLALNSELIIFTCPHTMTTIWDSRSEEDLKQLTRRVDSVVRFPTMYPINNAYYEALLESRNSSS